VLPAGGERGSGGEGNLNVLCNVLFLYIRKLAESRYVVLPSPTFKCYITFLECHIEWRSGAQIAGFLHQEVRGLKAQWIRGSS